MTTHLNQKNSFGDLHLNVIQSGLCVRCGLCVASCPVQVIGFTADSYPCLSGKCIDCGICVNCCPGGEVDFAKLSQTTFGVDYNFESYTGYVENSYIAYAGNESVRNAGASGGVVTGLLVYLLENQMIDGAFITGMDPEKPWEAMGLLATTSEEIVKAARSKYLVTPSMEALSLLQTSTGKYAVVGLPCQIHGLRKLEQVNPAFSARIAYRFGLFCHYNLEPNAAAEAIKLKGIEPSNISQFDFRGGAWPGRFIVTLKNGGIIPMYSISPKTVLNVMFQLYGAKPCLMCTDAMSEFADLSFGDFYAGDYHGELAAMQRSTLVFQRSKIGYEILKQANESGAIELKNFPEAQISGRNIHMARQKKAKAISLIEYRLRKGDPVPDYHFAFKGKPGFYLPLMIKSSFSYIIRKPIARRLIMKFIFSSFAWSLEWFIVIRNRFLNIFRE